MASISKTDTPFGKVCSIIASYVGPDTFHSSIFRIKREVNLVWIQIWQESEPHRYIDWALCDRIISFPISTLGTKGINQFLKHIYPLLVEIASNTNERFFFTSVANNLKGHNNFLSIIPTFYRKSESNAVSRVDYAHQGVALTEDNPNKYDSFLIKICVDMLKTQVMVDKNHSCYIGHSSNRSTLLHELIHVDHMLQEEDGFRSVKTEEELSFRWTNQEERETIRKENKFLENRGEMTRLSHKVLDMTLARYQNLSSIMKLEEALLFGADGTVRHLCTNHLASSTVSSARLHFTARTFVCLARAFLREFPESDQIIHNKIDKLFQGIIRSQKKLALIDLLNFFEISDQPEYLKKLIALTRKEIIFQKRTDLISFIVDLQIAYKV